MSLDQCSVAPPLACTFPTTEVLVVQPLARDEVCHTQRVIQMEEIGSSRTALETKHSDTGGTENLGPVAANTGRSATCTQGPLEVREGTFH